MAFQTSAITDEELVHDAVRLGHVMSLEIYLNQNAKCIDKRFTFGKSTWTPLLAACFYKHEHVVRMLLARFQPDTEALGTVILNTVDNRMDIVEDVSPLWMAAAVNHFGIVRLLVERRKANINHLIKTHSTALRAACYHNNLEMVKYLVERGADPHQSKKGNCTNLMLCTGRRYLLLVRYFVEELKCDVNERDENGQTALYYAVRCGSAEITKYLLDQGAVNSRDYKRKVTPLMRAALFGEIDLVDAFDGHCTDLEWIEAKELLATSFSGSISRLENVDKAIEYLTEAFELRLKKNLPKQISTEPLMPLNSRRECQTLDQFHQLISSNTRNALHIESVFIHQRILGDDQSDYHDVIYHYGAILAHDHQYHECFRWWFYEFNLKQKFKIFFPNHRLSHFVSLFARMKYHDHVEIEIEDLIQMFDIMRYILRSEEYRANFDDNLVTLLDLIAIAACIVYDEKLEENQGLSIRSRQQLLRSIESIVRLQYKTTETGSSLLNLCTNVSTSIMSPSIRYPCWTTARLLIDCHIDLDSSNIGGNTALHNIVLHPYSVEVLKIIDFLHKAGAHMDYANKQGFTALQLAATSSSRIMKHLAATVDVLPLKCCCAHLIRKQEISYENIFSTCLAEFVRKH